MPRASSIRIELLRRLRREALTCVSRGLAGDPQRYRLSTLVRCRAIEIGAIGTRSQVGAAVRANRIQSYFGRLVLVRAAPSTSKD
jgi:hypothetical protein